MKVAIIHEWFTSFAGSERVVAEILALFPQADVFCLFDFLAESERAFLAGRRVTTSFLQRVPFTRSKYRWMLPLMPLAVEQFDLSGYDLVISQNHAVAKGVITGPDQLHISYVSSPMRYAWDLQHQYLHESGLACGIRGWIARRLLHKLRIWDARTAAGVDCFVANSRYIARRIRKAYRREAVVIHPPVDVDYFSPSDAKEDFFVTASRFVPYKKVALLVEAFSAMPHRRLIVIGDGPEQNKVKRAAGPNVTLLGHQPRNALRDWLQRARAFVFAAEEDFGITLVEAQACGTPVIAYGRGGAREIVSGPDADRPTGILFAAQSAPAIQQAVDEFEQLEHRITPQHCRQNAERFHPEQFRSQFRALVEEEYSVYQAGIVGADDGKRADRGAGGLRAA
jgi:glycosyltransferase involved in cell wall biosynthesis